MKLLSFGETVWDVYNDRATLGGAPLNLAVHAAINGADATLISAVGNDKLGGAALERIAKFGVNTDHISELEGIETAKCTVTDGEDGLPSYSLANDAAFDRIVAPDITEYTDVICFGTLALRYENNRSVIERILRDVPHGEVFCDVNLRAPFYCHETVEYCFSKASIIKVSSEEFPEVCKLILGNIRENCDAVAEICDIYNGIKLFIVTLGENGAMCYDRPNDICYRCDAKKTDVISTVGAGDSFSAAFLTRYMEGCVIPDCLEYATTVSAMVCSCDGAFSEDMAAQIKNLNNAEV